MIIREATIFDHTGILSCIIKWIDEAAISYPKPNNGIAEWVTNVLMGGYGVVAEKEGKIVGTIGMTFTKFPWNNETWIMNNEWIHVDKEHRKGGTASKLIEAVKSFANERKLPIVMGIVNGVDIDKKTRFMKISGATHSGSNFVYGL